MSVNDTAVISRQQPPGNIPSRPWTSKELGELRRLAPLGAETIAELLERSVWSVRKQAQRIRISLRPEGERRGTVLGQPRGVSMLADARRTRQLRQLREDVLAGRVDVARAERRGRAIALGRTDCPSCSVRPIEVESTGFCEDCHLEALALGHALEADRAEAQRGVDRERQRKHRSKGGPA